MGREICSETPLVMTNDAVSPIFPIITFPSEGYEWPRQDFFPLVVQRHPTAKNPESLVTIGRVAPR